MRFASEVRRRAISLLEVILALAILGIASAYLSQAMQLAALNAIRAQRLTQAELVAESVMNQVIGGVIPAQPATWAPYSSATATGAWNYSLAIVPAEMQGMIGIQIGVQEVIPGALLGAQPADLVSTRWIIDPALMLDVLPAEEPAEEDTAASGQSGSQGAGQSQGGQAMGGQAMGGQGMGGQGMGGFGGQGGQGGYGGQGMGGQGGRGGGPGGGGGGAGGAPGGGRGAGGMGPGGPRPGGPGSPGGQRPGGQGPGGQRPGGQGQGQGQGPGGQGPGGGRGGVGNGGQGGRGR